MATLTVTRNYADETTLTEAQLDAAFDSVETFINTTKLNSDNIQTGGVAEASIAGSAVTETKIGTGAVTTAKLGDNAVTTVKITDANVTAAKLASDSVTTVKIVDSNVTTAKIADSNITTVKIADSNVTTAKIADSNVTTAKIADSNVTTAKINDAAVTTAKVNDGAITQAKRAALTIQSSGGSGTFSTNSGTFVSVTNLSFTLATTGRHVYVGLMGDPAQADCYISSNGNGGYVSIDLDGSNAQFYKVSGGAAILQHPPGCVWTILQPSAGSHTFSIKARGDSGSTIYLFNCSLVVYEL